jgi:hypothetical protein
VDRNLKEGQNSPRFVAAVEEEEEEEGEKEEKEEGEVEEERNRREKCKDRRLWNEILKQVKTHQDL